MKCPMCNGSGKCYEQKITYQEIETNRTNIYLTKCHKCGGSGEVELINEEWFCQLSTEEKAEVLFDIWYDGKVLAWDKAKPFYYNRFVAWLKEVHKDEMQ